MNKFQITSMYSGDNEEKPYVQIAMTINGKTANMVFYSDVFSKEKHEVYTCIESTIQILLCKLLEYMPGQEKLEELHKKHNVIT